MSQPIAIEKHEPERRRPAVTTAYCGCTCCCCCCLHSIGSVIGAAIMPILGSGSATSAHWAKRAMMPSDDDDGFSVPDLRLPPRASAVTLFWWLTCALVVLGLMIPVFAYQRQAEPFLIAGILILLAFPIIQLASVVLTAFIIGFGNRPDRSHQFKQLGKITGGIVSGTILGMLAMTLIWAVLVNVRF